MPSFLTKKEKRSAPAKNYDLIITNNPIHQTQQIPVYYLKNDLDLEDLAQIRRMIFH